MRALLMLLAAAAAAPAAAQDFGQSAQYQLRMDELRAQQQLLQQQQVAQHNELVAMEARLRTEQHAARIQAERAPVLLPRLPYPAPVGNIDTSKLPSIPDKTLADSDRRVREISQNRR
ncbi:hypothetical protein [Phenylobacterium sp.]|uniref:hypothetical protein n=1 Tax=Phenylobacterium sp. TaxID=1871053 RepID=UPI0028113ED5|nr:hypothetical protein [Phenylobacterium sp.]